MLRLIASALLLCFVSASAFAQTPPGTLVQGVVVNRSTVNRTATITTGNTFQAVLSSNYGTSVQRQALTIQNNNATDSCWITFGTLANGTLITAANATKANSILLIAGGSYTRYFPFAPSDEFEATCASNNDTLYIEIQ